jgi:hypothetical protein
MKTPSGQSLPGGGIIAWSHPDTFDDVIDVLICDPYHPTGD